MHASSLTFTFIITQSTPPFQALNKWRQDCFCFLLALQMVSWSTCAATSRLLTPNEPGWRPGSLQVPSGPSSSSKEMGAATRNKAYAEVGLGSSPPRCGNKCYGCMPCEAIQVPTTATSKRGHVGQQYTNYEPESWKCKCGHSLYSP